MSDVDATRRICILVDLEGYTALDAAQQHLAQRSLDDALSHAAQEVDLHRLTWHRQEGGDGELAVLPDRESQTAAVGAFPRALTEWLQHSGGRSGLRLRVRLAMVYGVVRTAAMGYSGHAVIEVARIADAPPVRRALAEAPEGHVVLALSSELFRDVIKNGTTPWSRDDFRRVRIDRADTYAWVAVPGVDPRRVPFDSEEVPDHTEVVQVMVGGEAPVTAARDVNAAAVGRHSTGYQTNIAGSVTTDYFHIGPRRG